MAQGGSANGDGTGGASAEGGSFKNEINTSLRHYYGAFCYASAMGNMSDQFYIVNNKENIDNIKELYNQYAEYYEYTIDELAEDYKARLVVDICETQKIFTQLCNAVERRTQRRLFKIPR